MRFTRVTTSWGASGTNTGTHGVAHSISLGGGQSHVDGFVWILERTSNVAVDPNSLSATSAVISRTATTSGSVVLGVGMGAGVQAL